MSKLSLHPDSHIDEPVAFGDYKPAEARDLSMFTRHALAVINRSKKRNACFASCVVKKEKHSSLKRSSGNTSVASSAGRYSAASRASRQMNILAEELKVA